MNESMFSVAKGAQLAMFILTLLLALATLQAFSVRHAEAAPIQGPTPIPTFPCPIVWTGGSLAGGR